MLGTLASVSGLHMLTFGRAVAALALTSRYVGSFYLAIALIVVMGISSSTCMISIMSSLKLLVPDHMRGRVMGFYGMPWSIIPLGAAQAGGGTSSSRSRPISSASFSVGP